MKITIKNSWDSLTWKEYEQLEQILNTDIPADYKTVHVIALLSGLAVEEVERIPVNQFNKILPALEFLKTEPETHYHQFEYTINGREYDFKGKLQEITTAQYIDYRAYISEEDKDIVKLMSVFLIPKGHEYNDGYDMEQVINDINDMCWLDLRAAAFFFRIQLAAYILILKSSLEKTLKATKKNKTPQEKKQIQKDIIKMEEHLNNTVCFLLSSESANTQMMDLIR
jgi:hypothetical protein